MAKQVYFFVLSVIILALAIFLGMVAENNPFNRCVVAAGFSVFLCLQVIVWVILPLDKKGV